MVDKHGNVWALLTDKVYVGIERKLRSISPNKKPLNRGLMFQELERNNNHASDLVLIEN